MARIILIDDEASIRRLVVRVLERAGHEVRAAEDGRAGVELHRREPADLIITDLFMPEQNGIETIRQIRAFAPTTPILVMSGGPDGSNDALGRARRHGAQGALEKPFSLDELKAAVSGLLARD